MAYTKTAWVDGTTAITATELNRIETGIEDAHAGDLDPGAITTDNLETATSTSTGVTYGKLAHIPARTVMGRLDATTGAPASISASADGQVLRQSGTTLGFGLIGAANVTAGSLTPATTSFFDSNGASGGVFAGRVSGAGAAVRLPSGWPAPSRSSEGVYVVTHNLGVTSVAFTATCSGANSDGKIASVNHTSTNAVTITVYNVKTTAVADQQFDFVAVRYA